MATDTKKKLPKGIRQRGKRYEGRVMYKDKRYSVHADTITECKRLMTDLKYKLEHGQYIEKNKMLYSEWFAKWLEKYKAHSIKRGTLETYQTLFNSTIAPALGDEPLSSIRGEQIQDLYIDMLKQGKSHSTIVIVASLLSGSFQQAYKCKLIESNPTEGASIPRKSETTEKKTKIALTREQQAVFLDFAKDSYLYNLFALMLKTGMRSGEARALRIGDIDRKSNVIHIERTLKKSSFDGTFYCNSPKTKTSKRDIPLRPDIVTLLDAQKKYWEFKYDSLDRFLFCDESGNPLSRERMQGEIDRIVRKINKSDNNGPKEAFPEITSHVFRHTFATRAIEAGMQPQVLKTILGHSSLAMTMDLYSHVLPDTKQEAMDAIAAAF